MKKLLAMILVLGMASLASAGLIVEGLEYEVDTSTNTITVTGTGVTGYLFNLMPDAGVLTNGVVSSAFTTVNDPGLWAGDYGEMGWAGASASTTDALGKSGVIFTINFDPGTTEVSFYESAFMGSSQVNFAGGEVAGLDGFSMAIPEPMTMALLGLGGLFLRRRK